MIYNNHIKQIAEAINNVSETEYYVTETRQIASMSFNYVKEKTEKIVLCTVDHL